MKYIVIETAEDLEKPINYFQSKSSVLGVDTETTELKPWRGDLRLIQLSDGNKTVVIDVFHVLHNAGYEFNDMIVGRKIFKSLKELLENPNIKKVIHNSKFEEEWFSYKLGITSTPVFDTMIASQHLGYNAENDKLNAHNLGAVARRYLNVDMDKAEQRSDWSQWILTQQQLDYAALDPYHLPALREIMVVMLEQEKLVEAAKIDFESVPAIADAEIKGMCTNRAKYTAEIKTLEDLRKTASVSLQSVLRPTTGITAVQPRMFEMEEKNYGDVMLTSSSQMLTALKKLGVPAFAASETEEIEKAQKAGKYVAIGTGAPALAPIAHLYPVAKLLNDFRGVDKMTTNYGHKFLEHLEPDENNEGYERVHPDFYVFGAETGRMACKNPPMQTIPNGEVEVGDDVYKLAFRSCFDFPKGYVGVIADYSSIELRIAGEFSQDPVFLEAFNTGLDLHALTASTVFELPYEDCANDKHDYYHKYRYFAKRINFGIVYGIGAGGLSALIKTSVDEAKELLEKHRAGHPVLWHYIDGQKNRAKRTLRARTASGRVIRFNPPTLDEHGQPDRGQLASIARIGTNQPIQGTSADILKIALKRLYDRIKGMDAHIVNIVHDEIVLEVEESIAEDVRQILEATMKEAAEVYVKTVPIKVDAKVVSNWGQK